MISSGKQGDERDSAGQGKETWRDLFLRELGGMGAAMEFPSDAREGDTGEGEEDEADSLVREAGEGDHS